MSACSCTGNCKKPPYTCSGIKEEIPTATFQVTICDHISYVGCDKCLFCEMEKNINRIKNTMDSYLVCWNTVDTKVNSMSEKLLMLYSFIFGHHPFEKNLANRMQEVEERLVDLGSEAIDYMTHEEFHKRVTPGIENIETTLSENIRHINERINNLEENENPSPLYVLKLHERIDYILGRIVKLEDFNQHCFKDNPVTEIYKRFKEIEANIDSHEKYLKQIDKIALCDPDKVLANQNKLDQGIKRVEESLKMLSSELFSFKDCYSEPIYDVIDEHVNNIWRKIDELAKNFDDNRVIIHKEPYKCPLCEGKGGYYISGTCDSSCKSCNGKGIVWS